MLVVLVHVHVKPESVESFKTACVDNATHSLREPGIARFDVVQNNEDPTRFVLIEAYYTAEDPAKHKETDHYKRWRDTVEPMMAEPRQGMKYTSVFPADSGWAAG